MHILFVTPQVPYPPRQGTSIRNYNLIARLAQRHTIDLLSFAAPGDENPQDGPLRQHCRHIATVPQPYRSVRSRLGTLFASPLPDMALRLESAAMHELVQTWLRDTDYDIVQIEGIELAQYARHLDPRQSAFVFDDHNCEYLLQKRNALTDLRTPRRWHAALYSLIQWVKLAGYEAQTCNQAHATIAVSQPDRDALLRIAPAANIHVAPNGIDLAAYTRDAQDQRASQITPSPRPTLVFTGKMDYRPNIDAVLWFAREVLPSLVAALPDLLFQIVGMNPHARLDTLRTHPNIEITGTTPDVLPYLAAANVYVIPMRVGGGTRFKALEAMAASKAIVSTSLGVEGIGVQNGVEMLLADSADEFAVAILRLLADQQSGGSLTHQLGQAAHRFVAARYTWDRIIPTVEQLYTALQATPATNPRPLAHSDHTGVKP